MLNGRKMSFPFYTGIGLSSKRIHLHGDWSLEQGKLFDCHVRVFLSVVGLRVACGDNNEDDKKKKEREKKKNEARERENTKFWAMKVLWTCSNAACRTQNWASTSKCSVCGVRQRPCCLHRCQYFPQVPRYFPQVGSSS